MVFFFPAEVRAESLSVYGHPLAKTPNYDRLAADGFVFTNVHALHTQCSPSRAAMVTGRYVHSMGHRTSQHLVREYESQLFNYMWTAGYDVNWFGINDILSISSWNTSVTTWGPLDTDADADKMIASIKASTANRTKPFFTFVAPPGARPPTEGVPASGTGIPFGTPGYYSFYDGSASVNYNPSDIKQKSPLRPADPDAATSRPAYHSKVPVYRNLTSLDESFFYKLNANYLDRITATDSMLGSILDVVDSKTAIITSSDTGDFAGDYGLVEKWPGGVDDVLTRVPLIVRLPTSLRARRGPSRLNNPVQLFDVMPTVLDVAGINVKHTHFAKSLVPVMTGAVLPSTDSARYVFSEGGYLYPTELEPLNSADDVPGPNGDKRNLMYPRGSEEMEDCTATLSDPNAASCHGSPRVVMIRNRTIKLAYRPNGKSEMYDLLKDSQESQNVWDDADYGGYKADLLGRLRSWFLETSDTTDFQLKTGRGAPAMPGPKRPLVPPNGTRKAGDNRPNVVFYFPDETRAESLGTFGHPITKTPNYDRLAATGVVFTQAHVLHTQCAPSRHAMITGRYLHTTGHRTQDHGVEAWERNIWMDLHENGYYNCMFGKNDMLSAAAFKEYVNFWEGPSSSDIDAFLSENMQEPFFMYIPTIGAHPPYKTKSFDDAGGLKLNLSEAFGGGTCGCGCKDNRHVPSYGEPGFFSFWNNQTTTMYDPDEIKRKAPLRPFLAGDNVPPYRRFQDGIPAYHNLTTLDETFFYQLNAVYLEMVSFVDAWLGEILDSIENSKNKGLKDRTVIITSADHGDFSGDHGCVEKWPGGVDDVLTRVPLIISAPAAYGGGKPFKTDAPVQLFDVYPTILDYAGIKAKHTHFAKSLMPVVTSASVTDAELNRFVFSEGGYLYPTEIEPMSGTDSLAYNQAYYPRAAEEGLAALPLPTGAVGVWAPACNTSLWNDPVWTGCHGSPRVVMIANRTIKLVFRAHGVAELFDRVADPRELTNVHGAPAYAALQAELYAKLLDWYIVTTDVTPLTMDPRGLPPDPATLVN